VALEQSYEVASRGHELFILALRAVTGVAHGP
jgi:hypothetical protein